LRDEEPACGAGILPAGAPAARGASMPGMMTITSTDGHADGAWRLRHGLRSYDASSP
jgi:hypothetical protein